MKKEGEGGISFADPLKGEAKTNAMPFAIVHFHFCFGALGEGGIRTLDTLSSIHTFSSLRDSFNHSFLKIFASIQLTPEYISCSFYS